jgi:predicted GIY-YIG superfamily endonuclease
MLKLRANTHPHPRPYFVYILASESRELYIGVSNDIVRRLYEHRSGLHPDSYAQAHATFRLVCGVVRGGAGCDQEGEATQGVEAGGGSSSGSSE